MREYQASVRARSEFPSGQPAFRVQWAIAEGRLDDDPDRQCQRKYRHPARMVHELRHRPDFYRQLRLSCDAKLTIVRDGVETIARQAQLFKCRFGAIDDTAERRRI